MVEKIGKTIRFLAWATTAALALAFLTQPVSVNAQLTLALSVIAAMAGVWRFGRGAYARWVFLALGSIVVSRYIFWRATSTLPPLDQPVNLALGLLLMLAELYCVLILIVSLIINADPLDRKPLERNDDEALPTVDVFIPTYNEEEYILATTVAAAKSMDYPAEKLTVWLLDDGGTDQKVGDNNPEKAAAAMARRVALTKLAEDLDARYLTRAKNEHAKAGNMNNGLQHAKGEIVVVFDADHAPFRSFLRETIGHFAKDPKLFLVQTPHVFLNPDPVERNLKTFQSMPSENEMFYSVTQRGLDKWNGSFFCGSAALLRRAALDVAGGFSGITITEDCETAFELHGKGWNSVYVDKPLIAGLQPETFESFIGQRSRWCQGMFQILLLKNPLFKKGLKPIQKLAYLSSMTFWFFPLPRMVFTFAPLLHVFFDVKIFVSSMDEAFAYTATYMAVNLMLQNYLYGRVRWPFVSELYEYVQGVYLARAIVAVVAKPRKPTFNVTAKGISLDNDHLSSLAWPFFAIFGVLLVGATTALYRYFTEPGAELMLIVGLWTSFNLVIAGVALGVVAERRELDRHPRLAIDRRGILGLVGASLPVTITSVSAGGCSVRFADEASIPADLAKGASCTLLVAPIDGARAGAPLMLDLVHATRGDETTTFGFSFGEMNAQCYMALADLMYGDPGAIQRFIAKRRKQKNLLLGSWQFLRWGVLEPLRATTLALARRAAPAVTATVTVDVAPGIATVEPIVTAESTMAAPIEVAAMVVATEAVAAALPMPIGVATHEELFDGLLAAITSIATQSEPAQAALGFDEIVADLVAAAPTEKAVDHALDWSHAVLRLAADEMSLAVRHKETRHDEARHDERQRVAA